MWCVSCARRCGWFGTVAIGIGWLLVSPGYAAAAPINYPEDPPQPCGAAPISPGSGVVATSAFIPVAGDPAAYQKCGPAGTPLGIKHCPSGYAFDQTTSYCIPQQGTDATLSVDSVWKGASTDSQPCVSSCQPKPIDVKLNYSASSAGPVSLTVADPAGAQIWGGSADMLTGDGQTHSVVVAANNLNPQTGDWSPKPGDPIVVRAYLTTGKSNPDGDPLVVAASTAQSVTASSPPTGQ